MCLFKSFYLFHLADSLEKLTFKSSLYILDMVDHVDHDPIDLVDLLDLHIANIFCFKLAFLLQ